MAQQILSINFSKQIVTALSIFAVLLTFTQGAPTGTISSSSPSDAYSNLNDEARVLHTVHKETYDSFKLERMNDVDIGSDLSSINVDGLPQPQSRYLVINEEEKDVLVLHRDNLHVFKSFFDVMHMEEFVRDDTNLDLYHEEFAVVRKHLETVVVKVNALLHILGHADSIGQPEENAIPPFNNEQASDLRKVKVMDQLYHYLPSAMIHFSYLSRQH